MQGIRFSPLDRNKLTNRERIFLPLQDIGHIIIVDCNSISGDSGNHVTSHSWTGLPCSDNESSKQAVAAPHLKTCKAAFASVCLVLFYLFFISHGPSCV